MDNSCEIIPTPTATTTPSVHHALGLLEIVEQVAIHLDPADILACSAVSKLLRDSFAPLVWRDLRFEYPWTLNRRTSPYSRNITAKHPDKRALCRPGDMDWTEYRRQLAETFCNITPWVRSLTIYSHDSIFPSQLGAACSRIESITVGIPYSIKDVPRTAVCWTNCKLMMRRNRDHLRSLSLPNWISDGRKRTVPGQPNWNPLLACTKSYNLRSLNLACSCIPGRHMDAFWTVGARLEVLILNNVFLHLDLPRSAVPKKTKRADSENPSRMPSKDMAPRFPRLKELTVKDMGQPKSLHQLDLLICQCPVLQILCWVMYHENLDAIQAFTRYLSDSTWPVLDSITIGGCHFGITDAEYRRMLQASKRPLRRLELTRASMGPETYDVLRTGHFSVLETIDLLNCTEETSQWTVQVLTSCPGLRRIKAKFLKAKDVLQSNKPWVCHGLQEFELFIDMGFSDRGPYRRLTEEELGQCRAIFTHLAGLKELRVLEMLSTYPFASWVSNVFIGNKSSLRTHLVSLPFRLQAGLGLLAGLTKLQKVGFWSGRHETPMKELQWMVQHWTRLEYLASGCVVLTTGPAHLIPVNECAWSGQQTQWLQERMISTSGSRYQIYEEWDEELGEYEDCCGMSESEEWPGEWYI
ncbi:hypothetical protein B0O80DRAFT_247339 [Mortierella sp. GBAus27b]|nr:hypothetical protein BGX31_007279 [Mortierella sp. GBA43]KAI8346116.1 hypothetical protein B0O80DRAFT_247339 [Mortierella sp. GBAus27b]